MRTLILWRADLPMYNLLMSANEDAWEAGHGAFERARFLEYTDDALRERFSALDAGAIETLTTIPALFTYERFVGKPVRLGRITGIRATQREVAFTFAFYPEMIASAQAFAAQLHNLEIGRYEVNRSHWAVKNADVLQTGLFRGEAPPPLTNRIFVVHGHDHDLKDSVADYLEGLGLEPVVLHREANRGRTIIEKFEECADVGFAVVLMTPDDTVEAGGMRARQNVILELGYFIGKLGRNRVCALKKGRVELPSDILGVLFTEVDANGQWQAELRRELAAAEYQLRD